MQVSLSDIFWLFIALTVLQPALKQRIITKARAKLIRALELSRGTRVILLVHRQETLGFLGIPVFRYIDIADAEQVIQVIQQTEPDRPIDLVLHTPGGLVLPSVQIARALARHPAPVRVLVPHYAMSGGTLIALAADEIIMSEHATLGPVDPQIGTYPAVSLLRAVREKEPADIDDETLVLADQARMAVAQVSELIRELSGEKMSKEDAARLAHSLTDGRWTHDYGITFDEARQLGMPVVSGIPSQVLELMTLYPQPVRQRPSVEYLPDSRRRGARGD